MVASTLKKFHRGIALFLSMAVLLLILLVGLTFIYTGLTESKTTVQNIHKTRARFAASSGIQQSIAYLLRDLHQKFLFHPLAPWAYRGEDQNRDGVLESAEDENQNNKLDVVTVPVAQALSPSYPRPFPLGGQTIQVSGILPSEAETATFTLKIIDENTKLNVNAGDPSDPNQPYNEVLQRLLNTLGDLLKVSHLGDRILEHRPPQGYDILERLIPVLGNEDYEKTRDFLTARNDIQPDVVQPLPLTQRGLDPVYPSPLLNQPILSWRQLWPKGLIRKEERPPINVNVAPKEILAALLAGLQGYYLSMSETQKPQALGETLNRGFVPQPYPLGTLRLSTPISLPQAEQIAEALIQRRQALPFTSFAGPHGFNSFCQGLVQQGLIDPVQADVLEANANPDTDINVFNPDKLLFKKVDKLSLTVYSTEFTFLPMGYFEVTSLGRVWSDHPLSLKTPKNSATVSSFPSQSGTSSFLDSYLLAEAIQRVRIRLYTVRRWSTQADFLGSELNLFSSLTSPDQDIEETSQKSVSTRLGLGLESYPNRLGLDQLTSQWDGQVMLATLTHHLENIVPDPQKNIEARFSFSTSYEPDYLAEEEKKKDVRLIPDQAGMPELSPEGIYTDLGHVPRFGESQGIAFQNKKPFAPGDIQDLSQGQHQSDDADIPVIIPFYSGQLTIQRSQLVGFLKELNIKQIYTGFSAATGQAGSTSSFGMEAIGRSKQIYAFLPHSCCFWDVYFQESPGGVHFFVPKHAADIIDKYFPRDVIQALKNLCSAASVGPSFSKLFVKAALDCSLSAPQTRLVLFWMKPFWEEPYESTPRGHILFSFGRYVQEGVYGKNKSAFNFEQNEGGEEKIKKAFAFLQQASPWDSSGVQDLFLSYNPSLPLGGASSLFPKGFTFFMNGRLSYGESFNNTHALIFHPFPDWTKGPRESLDSHRWYHVGLAWRTTQPTAEENLLLYLDGIPLKGIPLSLNQEGLLKNPEDHDQPINPGYRFGDLQGRPYGRLDQAGSDPWALGFMSPDVTYDEVSLLKHLSDSDIKELIGKIVRQGRFYNGPTTHFFSIPESLMITKGSNSSAPLSSIPSPNAPSPSPSYKVYTWLSNVYMPDFSYTLSVLKHLGYREAQSRESVFPYKVTLELLDAQNKKLDSQPIVLATSDPSFSFPESQQFFQKILFRPFPVPNRDVVLHSGFLKNGGPDPILAATPQIRFKITFYNDWGFKVPLFETPVFDSLTLFYRSANVPPVIYFSTEL